MRSHRWALRFPPDSRASRPSAPRRASSPETVAEVDCWRRASPPAIGNRVVTGARKSATAEAAAAKGRKFALSTWHASGGLLADKFASPPQWVQLQRTLPQRSRQHHWQRLRPQRSIQQRRQRTSVRSLLRLLTTLLAAGTGKAADAVEEPAASKSPANPSAITVFCITRLSLSAMR